LPAAGTALAFPGSLSYIAGMCNDFFKRLVILMTVAIMSVAALTAHAQKTLLASLRQNVVFEGMPNPITVMIENCGCNDVVVTTDNGTIRRYDNCSYDYTPSRTGLSQVIVRKKGSKTSSNILLRVNPRPQPVASLAKLPGGGIRKSVLEIQLGLLAGWIDYDFKTTYKVEHFMITMLREGKIIFTRYNKGARFEEEVGRWIKAAKQGDGILFYDIEARGSDNSLIKLSPVEYRVNN